MKPDLSKRVGMCFRKTAFWDEDEIKYMIWKIEKKEGKKLRYYICPVCYGFHMTKRKRYENTANF